MKELIGFSGRKGSGKSMFASLLKEKHGAEVISLATPIKNLCAALIGVPIDELNNLKNSGAKVNGHVVGPYLKPTWVETIMSEVPGIPEKAVSEWADSVLGDGSYTVRRMLQTVGTELIRAYDEDWHVRRMLEAVRKSEADMVVVDDIRFPNERQAFEKAGGKVFFVLRPDLTIPVSNHSSENSIHWYDFDEDSVILNMYGKDFMEREFEDVLRNPMYRSASPIMASSHDTQCDPCFGRLFGADTDPVGYHYMRSMVIPSMAAHNGCLVVNTDRVSEVNWLKGYIPRLVSLQMDPYRRKLSTVAMWDPFVIENVKEWM